MCGILALFGESSKIPSLSPLHNRGPDENGYFKSENVFLGHTRLSIVNPEAGPQPIYWKDWVLIINGEIYNADLNTKGTDCFFVPPLLEQSGKDAPKQLDGIFSFVAYRTTDHKIIVARDAIGVTPLYMGTADGKVCFSSLLAAMPLEMTCSVVLPGHSSSFYLGDLPIFNRWKSSYNPWTDLTLTTTNSNQFIEIMFRAVEKRLMGDVPWGVLLSGGLDSTTVLAIAQNQGYDCYTLSFDYGQRHRAELVAAERLSSKMGAKAHKTVVLDLRTIGGSALTDDTIDVPESESEGIPVTYVPARNTVFLSIALGWAEVLGANDGWSLNSLQLDDLDKSPAEKVILFLIDDINSGAKYDQ